MKKIIFLTTALLFTLIVIGAGWYLSKFKAPGTSTSSRELKRRLGNKHIASLEVHAEQAREYARRNGYNDFTCLLIDMSIESGKNRLFVYDLQKNSISDAGLVTHGRCNESWLTGRKYGNAVGCGCTSLGKYKIGNAYKGRFGLAYKLHGLDSTNNNAFKRYVVLHSHECVPGQEVDPAPICQSDGCPTVSIVFLKNLSKIIDHSSKPLLLWIYD